MTADAPASAVASPASKALAYAVRLLSRREYSRAELRRKLGPKYPVDVVEQVLRECAARNYQSDARFADMWCRHCASQGYGPQRFTREMGRHGIAAGDLEGMAATVAWDDVAVATLRRKVTDGAVLQDFACRQKMLAFLYRRGFTAAQCAAAVARLSDEDAETAGAPE